MCSARDRYTLIEQSSNDRITCMQYSQKNFMRIIGNEQKNNGQNFWEILERIIGKISSIIGAGLTHGYATCFASLRGRDIEKTRNLGEIEPLIIFQYSICLWYIILILGFSDNLRYKESY